ncbi:hypothetical protein BD560DRAFT_395626 [Blakeslea trispora]|nr:hypothetical protein BD560DRAFT_395626 [Blakeslea trispora]
MNPPNPSIESLGFTNFEHDQVREFLEKCHLLEYYHIFIKEGFESLTAIMEITEDDLVAMQVKRGHRRLIQRAIATMRGIPHNQSLFIPSSNPNAPVNPDAATLYDSFYQNVTNESDESSAYLTSGYGSMQSCQSDQAHTHPSHPNQTREPSYQLPPIRQVIRGLKLIPSSSPLSYVCYPEYGIPEEQGHLERNSSAGYSQTNNEEKEKDKDTPDKFHMIHNQLDDFAHDTNNNTSSNNPMNSSDNSSVDNLFIRRKYRRHPKPDKHAPLKPPSAYIVFSNDARSQLKHKNMSFVEMAKLVGDRWKGLNKNQRQSYERTAMKAKDEYLHALHAYKQTDQYKNYQAYLTDFKNEQEAANRKIIRLRKKAKRDLSESGSPTENSSMNDNPRSSSSSGSMDIYKLQPKNSLEKANKTTTPKLTSSGEEGSRSSSSKSMTSSTTASTTITTPDKNHTDETMELKSI